MEAWSVILQIPAPPSALRAAGSPLSPFHAALPLFIAIIVVTVAIMVIVTLRRKARSNRFSRLASHPAHDQLPPEAAAKRDLEALMVELDELAHQLIGRLDNRFAKLEATIRDADERIDRLNRIIRAQNGKAALDVTINEEGAIGVASTGESKKSDREPDDPHVDIYRLADQGLSPVDIAGKIGRSTGEIELILSLRRVREQAAAISAKR